jgi:hypothetical protein
VQPQGFEQLGGIVDRSLAVLQDQLEVDQIAGAFLAFNGKVAERRPLSLNGRRTPC